MAGVMQEDSLAISPASDADLQVVRDVATEYRQMWASLGSPFPCQFDGDRTDIDVLDFIEYEAGSHPRGLLGASLIWGEVFVKTGILGWHTNRDGQFYIGSLDFPRFLVSPYARILEIENTSTPQHDKYEWLLQRTIVDCLLQGDYSEEEEQCLAHLVDPTGNCGFIHSVTQAAEYVINHGKPA